MKVNGKEYVMTQQTEEQRKGHACEGCALKDTQDCQQSGRECVQRHGEVYKEVK